MYVPQINQKKLTRESLRAFGGYRRAFVIGEHEFCEMTNLTSDHYPALAPRQGRVQAAPWGEEAALSCLTYMNGRLFALAKGYGLVAGVPNDTGDGLPTDGEVVYAFDVEDKGRGHQVATAGAYAVIFPEGVYVNSVDPADSGRLDLKTAIPWEFYQTAAFHTWRCGIDGAKDSSGAYMALLYAQSYETAEGEESYNVNLNAPATIDISRCSDWLSPFQKGDHIRLDNVTGRSVYGDHDAFDLNGVHTVADIDRDRGLLILSYMEGQLPNGTVTQLPSYTHGSNVTQNRYEHSRPTVSLVIPALDYVVGHQNRLWGCRYGTASDGSFVNEVYATMQGDFHRWYAFDDGSPSDNAWVGSVGHPAPFTGAAVYDGRPRFFKEDRIYTVYGDTTDAYQLVETVAKGVQDGSSDSLAVVDGVLYYKAQEGVMAYDGSYPTLVSAALGRERYGHAVAGGHAGKYYVSMSDTRGRAHMFVYDARLALWHREDDTRVACFCEAGVYGDLFYTDGSGVLTCMTRGDASGERVAFSAETGSWWLTSEEPNAKYIVRLSVGLWVPVGGRVTFSLQYDPAGEFVPVLSACEYGLHTYTVPLRPARCDHARLRIEGVGADVKLYAITITKETGSDR